MARSVMYMSMSLDGFITGPHDGPGNGLGNGGHRLHEWLGAPVSERRYFDPPGLSGQVFAEAMATGSVIVGRKSFAYAGHWSGDHHGVPIFVPTRGTRHSRKGDTVGRAGLFRDCRLRRPRPGPRHRGFAGDAGRGSSTLTLEAVTTPSEYRLYRATIGGAFVLCPREPRQPCPVHGIAADHRAPVVPWRHPV